MSTPSSIIPDQSHINRVRDALWREPTGCASVMVGAGFSRNARPAGPHAKDFPLWHEVANRLCDRLYPSGDAERLKSAKAEASGTSGFLRLAQEFESAFGRGALHELIRDLVPDRDYVPDDIHARLLRLPWRDVYTTNWDTLLERGRVLAVDRAYSVVRTHEEIPLAQRPRIVKLHGTFPAHIPFVFTEEDYRTYPKRFAPFVNTVQQAMMETIFCLIGFSGDDPNFLYWSGWVRDNLGESSPKIYLAGWLDLSPHRRRMLEERNVVPIDVAFHPKAARWPEHLRHQYATEWVLHTLERGRPYDFKDWPSPPDWKHSQVPEPLMPVEDLVLDTPVEEPSPPRLVQEPTSPVEDVRAIIRAWEHNRKVYPGWLTIPPPTSRLLGWRMQEWETLFLRATPEFPDAERLLAIREFVWRQEYLLRPMTREFEALAESVLGRIDCEARRIGGMEDRAVPWAKVREAWRVVAMALVTAARQRLSRDIFERRLDALQPFRRDDRDVAEHAYFERCLWALNDLDFATLEELLSQWRPEGCDPMWMARKAAILAETDQYEEAVRLLNRSLSLVREAPQGRRGVASHSREGWILWLALAFEKGFLQLKELVTEAPPAFGRWQQLAAFQCDAFEQKRRFRDELRSDPDQDEGPQFDLGARRGKKITFSNEQDSRRMAARQAVRLCELAALPPSASHVTVGGDVLALAAEHLVSTDLGLALRLTLRVVTAETDALLERVWTRTRIAALSTEDVDALVHISSRLVAHALPRAHGSNGDSTFWVTRLRVAMEALSRLVLRTPANRAEECFRLALRYYRTRGVAGHPWLIRSTEHLLSRSWEALPKSSYGKLILDILNSPIAGIGELETRLDRFCMDPVKLLVDIDERIVPARDPETEGRWAEAIQMIIQGLRSLGESRARSAFRLTLLVAWKRLKEFEKMSVAEALWRANYITCEGLPEGTNLYDWVLLSLPEPQTGLAEERFRKKWLGSREPVSENDCNEFFWQVGAAIHKTGRHKPTLALSSEDLSKTEAILEKWIRFPLAMADEPWIDFGIREGAEGLRYILYQIDVPQSVAEQLRSKVDAVSHTRPQMFQLYGGIAKCLPSRLDDIAMRMRLSLASDIGAVAEGAAVGLHIWFTATREEQGIPEPPSDLLREIGVIIATRRKNTLNRSLQIARWVFTSGTAEQREVIGELTLQGLRYLLEELRYDRDHSQEIEAEVPLLRWGCAHLALSMLASRFGNDPTISRWADEVQRDPLPEVRYAERPTSVVASDEESCSRP